MTNTEKPWPFPGTDTRPTEAQTRANDLETPDGDSEEVTDEDIESAPGKDANAPGFIKPDADA
jgi:hypothetical protein